MLKQAAILAEMEKSGDSKAIAQAQEAIERDITFLSTPTEEIHRLYNEIRSSKDFDHKVEDFDLTTPPEVVEAARFLVELLLEK